MEFLPKIQEFYQNNNWRDILRLNVQSDNNNVAKILWVWPNERNLRFLRKIFYNYQIGEIISVGCGCGLLEWIIQQFTGLPIVGLEVNRSWWESKYSVPQFIPLKFPDDEHIISSKTSAMLFCYFNDGRAFREYIRKFNGDLVIIIGPGDGVARHADPEPFQVDFGTTCDWELVDEDEIKVDSGDFIAVYKRKQHFLTWC